jgi:hypothetical protein
MLSTERVIDLEKVYFTPPNYGGGLLNPLNYETVYSTP